MVEITSDSPPPDMMRAVQEIYDQHASDRVKYEEAAGALADGKNFPPDLRKIFVTMCLDVFDRMQNE